MALLYDRLHPKVEFGHTRRDTDLDLTGEGGSYGFNDEIEAIDVCVG
jgi:hypothetical protein